VEGEYTKLPLNYQMAINIPNNGNISQMDKKYADIFHSKALQNLPKVGFLVWKHAIWQPCVRLPPKSCPSRVAALMDLFRPKIDVTISIRANLLIIIYNYNYLVYYKLLFGEFTTPKCLPLKKIFTKNNKIQEMFCLM
jgi:hypothetical protein